MKKGFTLIEVIVVVIIIGIIASLYLSSFGTTKEGVLDKEAISNLKLLQVMEKTYEMDTDTYYPASEGSVSDIVTINNNLHLSLPAGSGRSWDYEVWSTGCVQATRKGDDERSWYFKIEDDGSTANCATDGEPNKDDCYTCP
ncbi:MAG: prepilin-type N-terminal cleavage/methylation domain-containing protein [Candidatus Omnitrophica bacterium]|nr:prepilin-type N-terminal cleavage/methylation domain-containing protein [Candidatus Omnitrophota bacterium]MDD5592844.1 prepilin-type N-terminal cleavage/methylation domain-containing protein [Candidatus Omnitrophota bacterium]